MGFSGIRAVILVVVFVVLLLGITRFDLPGWILPVGSIAAGVALKAWEKSASSLPPRISGTLSAGIPHSVHSAQNAGSPVDSSPLGAVPNAAGVRITS